MKPAELTAEEPLDWIPEIFRSMIYRDDDDRIWVIRGNEWVLREEKP